MKRKIIKFIIAFVLFGNIVKAEVQTSSKEIGSLVKLAEEFYSLKLYSDSISFYQNALEKENDDFSFETLSLKIGLAYFFNGDYEKSLNSLNQLKTGHLKTLLTSFCLRKTHSYELAEKKLLEFFKLHQENDPLLFLQLTAVALEKGNVSDAEYYFNQVQFNLKESHGSLKNILKIMILLKKGDIASAQESIKLVKKQKGESFEIVWLEGIEAYLSKNYLKSSQRFLKCIEKEDNFTRISPLISSFYFH